MIIPNNGKVVIFDDKIEQVAELMKALSSNNVPFSYFQDANGTDLPEVDNLIKNIRLVFMDIELETGVRHSAKSIISIPLSRLDRIIGENNGPYFLFIWSTKYEEYGELFISEVTTSHVFENKRPLKIIKLNKQELSSQGFMMIKKALSNEIESFDSLNAFFYWESIINDSAGEITNELISIIKKDEDWNQDTKNILYKLSSAYWGLSLKNLKEDEGIHKIIGAYSTMNQVLSDKIDYNTNISYNVKLNNIIKAEGKENTELFAKINEKIHIDNKPQSNFAIPGSTIFCIDELIKEIEKVEMIHSQKIERITIQNSKKPFDIEVPIQKARLQSVKDKESIIKTIREKQSIFNSIISDTLLDYSNSDLRDSIIKSSRYIEVNISPRCDFAQNKLKNLRLLPGVLVPEEHEIHFNKNADYNYFSDFKIHLEGTYYFFLFDYRFFYSIRNGSLKSYPKFRIKENFLNELQVKLSGHISRLGVLYMS